MFARFMATWFGWLTMGLAVVVHIKLHLFGAIEVWLDNLFSRDTLEAVLRTLKVLKSATPPKA